MSMFWGLCMKPNRKYTQTIVKSFHISGVAIDDGASAKLYLTADKNKFIVASLNKTVPQVSLDLNFCKGDKIMFQTTGDASVSLIGYLHDTDLSDDEDYDDEEYAEIAEKLQKQGGAKGDDNESGSEEEGEEKDDEKLTAEYSSFLEGEEEEEEDEDDSEDDDDSDDDDEESEEDDDDSDEKETPKAKKAKIVESNKKPAKEQNGVAKADQKQQQQQQQKTKKDKKAAAAQETKKDQPKAKEGKQQSAAERTIAGGVKVQDITTGNGPEAKQGKRVSVYYIGRVKSNNKTFDSMQKGTGFKFALGGGEVIKGWDVGVVGMKVGGKRRITCPAHMAYGARGHPPTIPPNSTLVFDVELKSVH